jgi:hypothetical protein
MRKNNCFIRGDEGTTITKKSLGLNLAQIAWVVKDIKVAKRFFQDVMGISNCHLYKKMSCKKRGWIEILPRVRKLV